MENKKVHEDLILLHKDLRELHTDYEKMGRNLKKIINNMMFLEVLTAIGLILIIVKFFI